MEYKCNICKTQYSSYKSRWLHNYKYHKHIKPLTTPPLSSTHHKPPLATPEKKFKCTKCNVVFSRIDSLTRHKNNNRCKEEKEEAKKLEEENNEIKKEMIEIKKKD